MTKQADIPFVRPMVPAFDAMAPDLRAALESGALTKGRYLDQYEAALAEHLEVRHAIAVSSCTLGLALVYRLLGLKGEVIVPSFTFMATVHPLMWVGATPAFVDIDPVNWSIDPNRVEDAITPRTTAIVAVHIFGAPAPIEDLEAIAERHGLPLIFDAAHGFGALHRGRPVGSNGLVECFSTSPTKLLISGEGGVVATNSDDLAQSVRVAREYGNPGDYASVMPGLNARLPEWSAILGLASLAQLEDNARRRNEIAARYRTRLSAIPGIHFQQVRPDDRSSYKDFSIRVQAREAAFSRDDLVEHLASMGIQTRNYYAPPTHRHPAYADLRDACEGRLPVTDALCDEIVSLPMWAGLSDSQVDQVCDAVDEMVARA